MTFIQKTRAKASMEQIATYPLRKVSCARMPAVSFAYRSGKNSRVFTNHNQMSVICHQALQQNLNAEAVGA